MVELGPGLPGAQQDAQAIRGPSSSGFPSLCVTAGQSNPEQERDTRHHPQRSWSPHGPWGILTAPWEEMCLFGCSGSGGMRAACVTRMHSGGRRHPEALWGVCGYRAAGPGEGGRTATLLIPLLDRRCHGVPRDYRGLGRAQSRN